MDRSLRALVALGVSHTDWIRPDAGDWAGASPLTDAAAGRTFAAPRASSGLTNGARPRPRPRPHADVWALAGTVVSPHPDGAAVDRDAGCWRPAPAVPRVILLPLFLVLFLFPFLAPPRLRASCASTSPSTLLELAPDRAVPVGRLTLGGSSSSSPHNVWSRHSSGPATLSGG